MKAKKNALNQNQKTKEIDPTYFCMSNCYILQQPPKKSWKYDTARRYQLGGEGGRLDGNEKRKLRKRQYQSERTRRIELVMEKVKWRQMDNDPEKWERIQDGSQWTCLKKTNNDGIVNYRHVTKKVEDPWSLVLLKI